MNLYDKEHLANLSYIFYTYLLQIHFGNDFSVAPP